MRTLGAAGSREVRPWLAVMGALLLAGCAGSAALPDQSPPAAPSPLGVDALVPSARLLVGRIVAVDADRRFAFVELAPDAPAAALEAGSELIARTLALQETARLEVSRQRRGRTLGTRIISGQPAPNDEVVWLAPGEN